jgi:fucose 4-O-acetylase-like acetyltransferase
MAQNDLSSRRFDVAKGFLILLIVVYHNDFARSGAAEAWFLPISFHVTGFLFLPFILGAGGARLADVGNRAVRYLVPFVIFTVGYAIPYSAVCHCWEGYGPLLLNILRACIIGSAHFQKMTTGMSAMWFLPALFSLVCLIQLHRHLKGPARLFLVTLCLLLHCFAGAIPKEITVQVPFGGLIACYVIPLGLLCRRLIDKSQIVGSGAGMTAALIFSLCYWYLNGVRITLFSIEVPTVADLPNLLANDAMMVSFMVALVWLSQLLVRIPVLSTLGRHSLQIYLFHVPILQASIWLVKGGMVARYLPFGQWGACAVTTVVTVSIAWTLSHYVKKIAVLQRTLFPRTLGDWIPARLFVRAT